MTAQDPGSYARPVRPVDGRPGVRGLEDLAIAPALRIRILIALTRRFRRRAGRRHR